MRPEIVAHQPGRSPHGHSGFAECCPPAETMPERIRREVPVGFVGHQLLPRLASAEHLVEAAPHIPERSGVVRVALVHDPIDLMPEGFGEPPHLATGFDEIQHPTTLIPASIDFQWGHHPGGRLPVHGPGVPLRAGDLGHAIPHDERCQL